MKVRKNTSGIYSECELEVELNNSRDNKRNIRFPLLIIDSANPGAYVRMLLEIRLYNADGSYGYVFSNNNFSFGSIDTKGLWAADIEWQIRNSSVIDARPYIFIDDIISVYGQKVVFVYSGSFAITGLVESDMVQFVDCVVYGRSKGYLIRSVNFTE